VVKPTVFISHITEEGEMARHLKELIERKFLRTIKVFVSSHEESISLGDEWLAAIKVSVTNCGLMVVICSPISVTRPWINFEAGAGWVRGIPVVPMCHSGIQPGQLPVPLNTLQGGLLGHQADAQKLFGRLAKLADIDAPVADDAEFFSRVHEFETSTRANVLLKDTQFIANLLNRSVEMLEYCIYASTRDYEFLNTLDLSQSRLEDHQFTFNDVHHLFNISLFSLGLNQKIYQAIQTIVLRLADSIRFILSNSHLEIAPELEELLNTFLYATGLLDNWADMIGMLDRTPGGENEVRNMMINMIKEEPLPPTKKINNMINVFINYYDNLAFYKVWIIGYKAAIARLTGTGLIG
jgi:hypothetical protein